MKYAMMGAGLRAEVGRTPPAEQERRIRCHQQALNDLLRARVIAGRTGLIFVSVGLGPFHGGEGQTLSVRNREGKRFRTDGPFPETKEVVGGFDIIDFASREEASNLARSKICTPPISRKFGRFANSGGFPIHPAQCIHVL